MESRWGVGMEYTKYCEMCKCMYISEDIECPQCGYFPDTDSDRVMTETEVLRNLREILKVPEGSSIIHWARLRMKGYND